MLAIISNTLFICHLDKKNEYRHCSHSMRPCFLSILYGPGINYKQEMSNLPQSTHEQEIISYNISMNVIQTVLFNKLFLTF